MYFKSAKEREKTMAQIIQKQGMFLLSPAENEELQNNKKLGFIAEMTGNALLVVLFVKLYKNRAKPNDINKIREVYLYLLPQFGTIGAEYHYKKTY